MNETSIILWHDPADVKWVSVNANGAQANSSSTGNLSVSADGRSIFFGFDASNLVDGDSNNQHYFFVANNPLCEASGGWRYCGADGTAEGDETRKAELHALIEEIVAYPDAMIEVKYRIRNRYRTEKQSRWTIPPCTYRHGGTHITSDNFSAQKIRCQNGVTGLLSVAGFWRCQSTSGMQYFSGCD